MSGRRPGGREREGFALIPALISVLIFSYIAYAVLAADRGALASMDAAVRTARLEAAADAGLATAVQALGADSAARRWSLDGRPHRLALDSAEVVMTVEDERGKAPLNVLTEEQWRRLFEAGGASGSRLDRLVDGAMDWRDSGQRLDGGSLNYARRGVRPRWGPLRTVGELAELDGMDAELLSRIAPAVTLFRGEGGDFDAKTAQPLALGVMAETGTDSVDAISRARELAGQRTALDVAPVSYVGRPLTVRVVARDAQGRVFRRAAVVEFTGRRAEPYWVRAID
jgi:general secretion pathway protein K